MPLRNYVKIHCSLDRTNFGALLCAPLAVLLALMALAAPVAAQFGSIAANDFWHYVRDGAYGGNSSQSSNASTSAWERIGDSNWGRRKAGSDAVDKWLDAPADQKNGEYEEMRKVLAEARAKGDTATLRGAQDALTARSGHVSEDDAGYVNFWIRELGGVIKQIDAKNDVKAASLTGRQSLEWFNQTAQEARSRFGEDTTLWPNDTASWINRWVFDGTGRSTTLGTEEQAFIGALQKAKLLDLAGQKILWNQLLPGTGEVTPGSIIDAAQSGKIVNWIERHISLASADPETFISTSGALTSFVFQDANGSAVAATSTIGAEVRDFLLTQSLAHHGRDPDDPAYQKDRAELRKELTNQAEGVEKLMNDVLCARQKWDRCLATGVREQLVEQLAKDAERNLRGTIQASPILGVKVLGDRELWSVLIDPRVMDQYKEIAITQAVGKHLKNICDQIDIVAGLNNWTDAANTLLNDLNLPLIGYLQLLLDSQYGEERGSTWGRIVTQIYKTHEKDKRLDREGTEFTYKAVGTGLAILSVGLGGMAAPLAKLAALGIGFVDTGVAASEYFYTSDEITRLEQRYAQLKAQNVGGKVDAAALEEAREELLNARAKLLGAAIGVGFSLFGNLFDMADLGFTVIKVRPVKSSSGGPTVFNPSKTDNPANPTGTVSDAASVAVATSRGSAAVEGVDPGLLINRVDAEVAAGSLDATSPLRDQLGSVLRKIYNFKANEIDEARQMAQSLTGTRVQFPGIKPGDPPMVFELTGEYFDHGAFNMVFGARAISSTGPQTPVVIKFGVYKGKMGTSAFEAFRGQLEGAQLLDQHSIPHVPLYNATTEGGVLVSLWARFDPDARQITNAPSIDDQAATLQIFQDVARAGLYGPDLKPANMVIKDGAKVSDTDLFTSKKALVMWQEAPSTDLPYRGMGERVEAQMSYYLHPGSEIQHLMLNLPAVKEAGGGKIGVIRLLDDPIHFTELMMVGYGWVKWDAKAQKFVSGSFDIDLVKLYFPQFGLPGARSADILRPPSPDDLAALGVKTGTDAATATARSATGGSTDIGEATTIPPGSTSATSPVVRPRGGAIPRFSGRVAVGAGRAIGPTNDNKQEQSGGAASGSSSGTSDEQYVADAILYIFGEGAAPDPNNPRPINAPRDPDAERQTGYFFLHAFTRDKIGDLFATGKAGTAVEGPSLPNGLDDVEPASGGSGTAPATSKSMKELYKGKLWPPPRGPDGKVIRDPIGYLLGAPLVLPGGVLAVPIRTSPENAPIVEKTLKERLGADVKVLPEKTRTWQTQRAFSNDLPRAVGF